jgi:hypothetical protein
MTFFNKVSNNAGKLFNKAMGTNGIFNKINEIGRKADNSIQRVGSFIRPIANHFGLGDVVKNGLTQVHNLRMKGTDAVNSVKNGLERAVKAPMNDINRSNYA